MSSHHHDHHQQAIILYSMCSATDAVTAAAVSALIKQPQTTACNSEVAKLNTNCTEGDTERETLLAADERE